MKNRWLLGTHIERSSIFCDPLLFAIQVLQIHMCDPNSQCLIANLYCNQESLATRRKG